MKNTIKLVYQDCPFCGSRKAWGDKQQELAKKSHVEIEKISFIAPEAYPLMKAAASAGIKSMPFFTDGKRFSKGIEGLIARDLSPKKKPVQRKRKKPTKKKEVVDGDNQ